MTRPPVLLLNVDGVLNAVTVDPPAGSWTRWERSVVDGWPILWSPDLTERLLALHETGAVELRWLTTWWDKIGVLPFPSGLLVCPVANDEDDYLRSDLGPEVWWKHPVARRIVEREGRRVVWCDDDLGFDRDARDWVASEDGRVLGVCPATVPGLTPEHLDRIERWVPGSSHPGPGRSPQGGPGGDDTLAADPVRREHDR